jgi:hypothetical protein
MIENKKIFKFWVGKYRVELLGIDPKSRQAIIKLLENAYRVWKWRKPFHKPRDRLHKEERYYEKGEILNPPLRTIHTFLRAKIVENIWLEDD